jgi:hypothetical protein
MQRAPSAERCQLDWLVAYCSSNRQINDKSIQLQHLTELLPLPPPPPPLLLLLQMTMMMRHYARPFGHRCYQAK